MLLGNPAFVLCSGPVGKQGADRKIFRVGFLQIAVPFTVFVHPISGSEFAELFLVLTGCHIRFSLGYVQICIIQITDAKLRERLRAFGTNDFVPVEHENPPAEPAIMHVHHN